ncbi:hypothetical protein PHYSODRAFT_342282 [Phytophthora sojae]|uniref:Uncharacterized protein n=1 Tax=Phytophthora sojae (strain P6497) TaxID=1094619 RepID=G5AFT4_PHYSP|nr:hypothetical protein PHYSODRAFT_342282 [Phytophthora sojae]EGZ05450.1 hypothetical protein PHYSODRAFT_342282 [Phytophthora sojae]|eukprot:XP_009538981.1 hypothetical protein PHYSODRAFT_342282 [Phytophthora sojae]
MHLNSGPGATLQASQGSVMWRTKQRRQPEQRNGQGREVTKQRRHGKIAAAASRMTTEGVSSTTLSAGYHDIRQGVAIVWLSRAGKRRCRRSPAQTPRSTDNKAGESSRGRSV